jgi:hypothetical protein
MQLTRIADSSFHSVQSLLDSSLEVIANVDGTNKTSPSTTAITGIMFIFDCNKAKPGRRHLRECVFRMKQRTIRR